MSGDIHRFWEWGCDQLWDGELASCPCLMWTLPSTLGSLGDPYSTASSPPTLALFQDFEYTQSMTSLNLCTWRSLCLNSLLPGTQRTGSSSCKSPAQMSPHRRGGLFQTTPISCPPRLSLHQSKCFGCQVEVTQFKPVSKVNKVYYAT